MRSERIRSPEFLVAPATRNDVKEFIESHHYSHSINGVKSSYCFTLTHQGTLIGAMLFGQMSTKGQWEPYGSSEQAVLELRRLVLVDDTPRNCESYFIGKALKWLKKNTSVECVVSYADPAYGHEGVVYKAANFKFVGVTSPTKVVLLDGKVYHDRALRTKYKGKYKPFAQRLRDAVASGEAVLETRPPKNIYVYPLCIPTNTPTTKEI